MFGWFKNLIAPNKVLGHDEFVSLVELRDKDYLKHFTGDKNGVLFEDANCHVEVVCDSGPHLGAWRIRGKFSVFQSGKVISGNYSCHTWEGGEFSGDMLKCRFFSGGVFNGKHLICEQVSGGICKSGTVECSSWCDAEFDGEVLACTNWKSGKFAGNIFHGKWRGGTWEGKLFKGIDLSGSGLEIQA